jgi:hypothetical protein
MAIPAEEHHALELEPARRLAMAGQELRLRDARTRRPFDPPGFGVGDALGDGLAVVAGQVPAGSDGDGRNEADSTPARHVGEGMARGHEQSRGGSHGDSDLQM